MTNLINSIVFSGSAEALAAGPIPDKEAIMLIKEYKSSEGWGDNKTRAVGFSVTELLQIVDQIKQFSGNGVRIYFAKYPDTGVEPPNPAYKKRTTLVFVPTNDGRNLLDVEALVDTDIDKIPDNVFGGGKTSNHGNLCPPNC